MRRIRENDWSFSTSQSNSQVTTDCKPTTSLHSNSQVTTDPFMTTNNLPIPTQSEVSAYHLKAHPTQSSSRTIDTLPTQSGSQSIDSPPTQSKSRPTTDCSQLFQNGYYDKLFGKPVPTSVNYLKTFSHLPGNLSEIISLRDTRNKQGACLFDAVILSHIYQKAGKLPSKLQLQKETKKLRSEVFEDMEKMVTEHRLEFITNKLQNDQLLEEILRFREDDAK